MRISLLRDMRSVREKDSLSLNFLRERIRSINSAISAYVENVCPRIVKNSERNDF